MSLRTLDPVRSVPDHRDPEALLAEIRRRLATTPPRRRPRTTVAVAAVIVAVAAGAAYAADRYLGAPASPDITTFLRVAERTGRDVTFDESSLRVVATSSDFTLFAGQEARGRGWCAGLVAADRSQFAMDCHQPGDVPVTVSSPSWVRPDRAAARLVVSGRVSDTVERLFVLDNGDEVPVNIEAGGYFLYEGRDLDSRQGAVTVRALLDDGRAVDVDALAPLQAAVTGGTPEEVVGRVWSTQVSAVDVRALSRSSKSVVELSAAVSTDGRFQVPIPDPASTTMVRLRLKDLNGTTIYEGEIPSDAHWTFLESAG